MRNCIIVVTLFVCSLFALNITGGETTEEFVKAVITGDIGKVEQFAKGGADVNIKDKDDVPLLVIAAEKGHLEVLRVLLDHGALPSAETEMGDTALIRAAAEGHEEVVLELISRKSEINHANMYMDTALATAARNDHTNIVKILLKHNANVNIYHVSGYPLICSTMLQGNMALVKILIEKGADVNLRTYPYEHTMLMLAVISGDEKLIEVIVKLGVEINAIDKKGYSALMHAEHYRNTKIMREIIRLGADLNIQDIANKQTALIHAAENEYLDSCELLIAAGADVNMKDLYGGTALSRAKATGNVRIIDMLEKAGAKMNLFSSKPILADAELTLREMENLAGATMWCSLANPDRQRALEDVPAWDDLVKYLGTGNSLVNRKGLDILGNKFILGSERNGSKVNKNTVKMFENILGGAEASKKFWGKYMPDAK